MRARTSAAIAALALCAPGATAQANHSPILHGLTALDAKRVEAVDRGGAVTITLDAADKTEIAMLGVVKLDVPRAFYLERVHDLTGFLESGMTTSAGAFGDPARLEDVAALALEPSDAKALEKCKPFACDVKLPADMMERLRNALGK